MADRFLTLVLLGGVLLVAGSCQHGPPPASEAAPAPSSPARPAPDRLPGVLGAPPLTAAAASRASVPPAAASPAPAPIAAAAAAETARRIDFTAEIQPLLEGCRPCHFEGGKMYEELPFDDPATVHALGERLFSRITEAEAQALLRAFLVQAETGPEP